MSSKQSTFYNLQAKGWTLSSNQLHPLGSLQGKGIDSYKLVVWLGLKNKIGAIYFQAFLQDTSGEISDQSAVIGLYNQGKYPSYNWIEILRLSSLVSFSSGKETVDISVNGLARQLLQYLADLIPPGGHMMIEYDSPEQQATARSLALGIPPIATPLGYLLFSIGCGASFKDWYFAEGWGEGARKLQGYKALHSQHAKLKTEEAAEQLKAFLDRPSSETGTELKKAARDRALAILALMRQHN